MQNLNLFVLHTAIHDYAIVKKQRSRGSPLLLPSTIFRFYMKAMKPYFLILKIFNMKFTFVFSLLCLSFASKAQNWPSWNIGGSPAYPWITNTIPSLWIDANGYKHHYGVLNVNHYDYGTADGKQTIIMRYDAAGNRIMRDWEVEESELPDDIKVANNKYNKSIIQEIDKALIKEPLETNVDVTIFPNPTCDKVTVEFSDLIGDNATLEVLDAEGKRLLSQNADTYNTLNISEFPSGFYIIVLKSGTKSKQWKINKI